MPENLFRFFEWKKGRREVLLIYYGISADGVGIKQKKEEKIMKRFLSIILAAAMIVSMFAVAGCKGNEPAKNESAVQKIIKEAQGLSLEELAKKAIAESKGKTFYGVGNSSRGKTALPLFIEYLQTIDPSYTMEFEWQQPKNNKIFDQLTADSKK